MNPATPIKSPLRLPSEVMGRVVNIIIPDMPGNIPQNYARQAGLSASPIKSPLRLPPEVVGEP